MISFACDRCDARHESRELRLPPGWSTRLALGTEGRELPEVLCRACDDADSTRQRAARTERMVRSAHDLRRKPPGDDDGGQGSLL